MKGVLAQIAKQRAFAALAWAKEYLDRRPSIFFEQDFNISRDPHMTNLSYQLKLVNTCEIKFCNLDINIFGAQGIVFDKLAAWFDLVAHERSEDGFSFRDVFEFHGE